jgi:hypothetical protein
MPKQKEQMDIINQAPRNAGERAYQQVMRMITSLPATLGTEPAGAERLTLKEVQRLTKGE